MEEHVFGQWDAASGLREKAHTLQSNAVQTDRSEELIEYVHRVCSQQPTHAPHQDMGSPRGQFMVSYTVNDPENGAQEDRLNLKECWDVFRPHRQHLRRSAQQAPGLMGDGQRAGGGGVGRIRPAVQGLDRVVAGSHCHTGRLVPKAVDHLDRRKGRLADCGLWRIVDHAAMGVFSVLSVEGRPALLFGKSCKAVIIHGSSVKRIL